MPGGIRIGQLKGSSVSRNTIVGPSSGIVIREAIDSVIADNSILQYAPLELVKLTLERMRDHHETAEKAAEASGLKKWAIEHGIDAAILFTAIVSLIIPK
jgi:hypothetical protein